MIISIKGFQFEISAPYQPLHQLTPGEAQALNSLRAENIRNNVAKLVNDAIAEQPEGLELTLPESIVAEIQAKITSFDSNYVFKPRHEPKPRPGPIDDMIRQVARERARAIIVAELGIIDAERVAELALQLVNNEEIRDEAARRASHLAKVANSGLEDLLG